jgi:hypothetical protein
MSPSPKKSSEKVSSVTQTQRTTPDHTNNDETDLDTDLSDNTNNITRRVKRKYNNNSPENRDSIMPEIKQLLSQYCQKQDVKFEALTSRMDTVLAQNTEIQKAIDFMSHKYDELVSKVDALQQENNTFRTKITSLEQQLELSERKSRSSSIEIRNIPKVQNENKQTLTGYVKTLGSEIKQPILDSDIRNAFRQKSKSEGAGSIVVELNSTIIKDNIIKSCIAFNKTQGDQKLNSCHVGLPGPSKPVYVAEYLTPKAQHLYYLARQYKKTHVHSTCWTSYGKVYVRQKEGMPAVPIDAENDLAQLK